MRGKVTFYKHFNGLYYYQITASNGKVLADSIGYVTIDGVHAGLARLIETIDTGEIIDKIKELKNDITGN
jgi:uncharacterized protein YegP (UPF0339 family)